MCDSAEFDGSHTARISLSESASLLSVFYVDRFLCGGQPPRPVSGPQTVPRLLFGKRGRKIERR